MQSHLKKLESVKLLNSSTAQLFVERSDREKVQKRNLTLSLKRVPNSFIHSFPLNFFHSFPLTFFIVFPLLFHSFPFTFLDPFPERSDKIRLSLQCERLMTFKFHI